MSDPLQDHLQRLPHGPEFRFVHRLIELAPGKNATGEYSVRGDEPFLRGHFPGQPIFPGVLLVEAAAQLAGIVAQSDPSLTLAPQLKLTAVRVKILGTAGPGDKIRLQAELAQRFGHLIHARVFASVAENPLLQGEITLSGSEPGSS